MVSVSMGHIVIDITHLSREKIVGCNVLFLEGPITIM